MYAETSHYRTNGTCRSKSGDLTDAYRMASHWANPNEWLNNNITNSLLGALIFFLLSLLLAKYMQPVFAKLKKTK